MSDKLGCKLKPQEEWIEMFPYGVVLGVDNTRSVLVFKDEGERYVLPVWLNPIEAHIAMSTHRDTSSPHKLTFELLKKLKVKVEKVHFTEVTGTSQKVDVFYKIDDQSAVQCLTTRAEDVMSFCLQSKARFFTHKETINQSRDRDWEMNSAAMAAESIVSNNVIIHRRGYLN